MSTVAAPASDRSASRWPLRRAAWRALRLALLLTPPILAAAAGPAALRELHYAIGFPPAVVGEAAAQEVSACAQGVNNERCVVVLIDHLRRLGFRDEVQTVLIGNPAIADVTMISTTEAVVTARTVGTTNMIFLNSAGLAIADFEVLVREGESQRVVLRRGPTETAIYQCAPRCERTLTQLDSEDPHSGLASQIGREVAVNNAFADQSEAADEAGEDGE